MRARSADFRFINTLALSASGLAMALWAQPVDAQLICPLLGGVVNCPGADPTVLVDVDAPAGPVDVLLGEDFQTNNPISIITPGNVLVQTLDSASITTAGAPGLTVNSGSAIEARITNILTSGTGATGAVLRAVDGVLFTADGLVSTVGDGADAINIQGGSVAVRGNILRTTGANANGVDLVSVNGPIDLNADIIETAGNLSSASVLRAGGPVNVDVGILRTQGGQALGLDIATVPAACVQLGSGGCSVTAAADQITTNGFGGIGALVSAVAPVSLNIGVLQTGGDQAAGINLITDPSACAALGVGACDTSFTVNELTTQGVNSPGALVRAAGNITGNVSVLRTNGNDAAGLDLASDPDACILLGAGACGTSFNVGQLTTSGAGATGVLASVAGPTTGRVTLLQTLGDNAPGIDITADPRACALIGSGACDVDLGVDRVTTQGNGAAAVLVNAPANILANIGGITTGGDGSPGLRILTDPAVCLALGPGSCGVNATSGDIDTDGDNSPGVDVDGGEDPVVVTTEDVDTEGDGSPGVTVTANGPITVTTGDVDTQGDGSPGVSIDGDDGQIVVATGDISTQGNGSPGVDVSGTGSISVDTGAVTTTGPASPAIRVVGGSGPTSIDAGPITTLGAASDGIDASTTTGALTVMAGPISATGAGSNGIVATASGCAAVNISAAGPITAAGTAISATSACNVNVTTATGAPVAGGTAGINVVSGTGAAITIGDAVGSANGLAINADGAAAVVTIAPTGSVTGYIDLTPGNDQVINRGAFTATADSDFGAGVDNFTNGGTLNVRPVAPRTAVRFTGLETFTNNGLIDLRNGAANTVFGVGGTFAGGAGSALAVDVANAPNLTADRLVIDGTATGSTQIIVNPLTPADGILVNGLVVVDAGVGSSPTAFTAANGGVNGGFVSYGLTFNAASGDYLLFATPSASAYELVKLGEGARQIWYRTSDAWASHMQTLRNDGGVAEDSPKRGSALWGQAFGSVNRDRSSQTNTVFGQTQTVVTTNKQDFFGGQIGYDMGGIADNRGIVVGVTAGYASSHLNFRANADRFTYQALNVGAYFGASTGPFFVNGLAKYERYYMRAVLPGAAVSQKLDGHGYGGMLQVGAHLGSGSFFIEPIASLDYTRSKIDTLTVAAGSFDFARIQGLRGKAGARIGTDVSSGITRTSLYVSGEAVREFAGRKGLAFSSGGFTVGMRNDRLGTYAHAVAGVSIATGTQVAGFIEAFGDRGSGYKGGGGRAGLSVRF